MTNVEEYMADVKKILKEMPSDKLLDIIRWAYLTGCKNPQIINDKGNPNFSYCVKDLYKDVPDYNIIHTLVKEGYLKEYNTKSLYAYVMRIFGKPLNRIRKIKTTEKGKNEIERIEKNNLPIITQKYFTAEEVIKLLRGVSTDVPTNKRYV